MNWNKDWDVHKALTKMGFKTWRFFEPGNISNLPHDYGYMQGVHRS